VQKIQLGGLNPGFTKLGYQVIAERVTIPEKITDDETGYNSKVLVILFILTIFNFAQN
jgi:hypothetical protein